MPEVSGDNDIYNGAQCKTYSWSQNHTDIEVRVKLFKKVKSDEIDVTIKSERIRIEFRKRLETKHPSETSKIILDGELEHRINVDSAYWLFDEEESIIFIYMDKVEALWWKQLLLGEVITQQGPKNYTVPMDQLDDGSRMVIDKLIVEQRSKQLTRDRCP